MIIHTRIKYSILLIIPLILLILLPTVSAANDNRISSENSKSIEALKQAIRINPDDAEAHYNLGNIYYKSSMYEEAIDEFKQAIRIDPDLVEAPYDLGYVYADLGMYKEAIEAFRQAIRINPDFSEAHCCLGLVYVSLNDKGSALEQYKILKSLDSERANELFKFINK